VRPAAGWLSSAEGLALTQGGPIMWPGFFRGAEGHLSPAGRCWEDPAGKPP